MPRPVRTRITSSRPANRETRPTAPSIGSAPKQNQPSDGSSSTDIYGVSDRELQRGAQAAAPKPAVEAAAPERDESSGTDIYGVSSDGELRRRVSTRIASAASASRPNATENTHQQAEALEAVRRRRDAAMGRLDKLSSTTATVAGQSSDQSGSAATASGRRAPSTTRRRRAADVSGIDMMDDDATFGDMDTSFEDQDASPPPARSTDTSSFNVGLFRRGRPRQSSVASREDAPIRPSSRGGNTTGFSSTFNLGTFKRRAREPSILGTGRKPLAQRPGSGYGSESAMESELEDEADAAAAPDSEPTTARTRKRKSTEGQDGTSKRLAVESSDDVHDSIELSSSPSVQIRHVTPPVIDDEILAPPASSGSSDGGSPFMLPSLKSLAKGRRGRRPVSRSQKTPPLDDVASDISSPPSLTHSPNGRAAAAKGRGRGRGRPAQRDPTPVTTADLASLLPRRRKKARDDPWDLDSDEDLNDSAIGIDDGDVANARSRRERAGKTVQPLGQSGATAGQRSKPRSGGAARRKYGSREFSDKENQGGEGDSIEVAASPLPDDTFDSPDGDRTTPVPGEELRKAVKKFKEVDKWELDFEEVTYSSSPVNAR